MDISYLIFSIISLIACLAFFSWGRYQIRTGKMVARLAVNPVDEPREVGMLFLAISFLTLWLTYLFAMMYFFPSLPPIVSSITDVFGTLVVILLPLAAIIAASLGIMRRRIFGIKPLPKIRPLIKKYYLLTNISTIILSVTLCVLFIFGGSFPSALSIILFVISVICVFLSVLPLIIISKANKH